MRFFKLSLKVSNVISVIFLQLFSYQSKILSWKITIGMWDWDFVKRWVFLSFHTSFSMKHQRLFHSFFILKNFICFDFYQENRRARLFKDEKFFRTSLRWLSNVSVTLSDLRKNKRTYSNEKITKKNQGRDFVKKWISWDFRRSRSIHTLKSLNFYWIERIFLKKITLKNGDESFVKRDASLNFS